MCRIVSGRRHGDNAPGQSVVQPTFRPKTNLVKPLGNNNTFCTRMHWLAPRSTLVYLMVERLSPPAQPRSSKVSLDVDGPRVGSPISHLQGGNDVTQGAVRSECASKGHLPLLQL